MRGSVVEIPKMSWKEEERVTLSTSSASCSSPQEERREHKRCGLHAQMAEAETMVRKVPGSINFGTFQIWVSNSCDLAVFGIRNQALEITSGAYTFLLTWQRYTFHRGQLDLRILGMPPTLFIILSRCCGDFLLSSQNLPNMRRHLRGRLG